MSVSNSDKAIIREHLDQSLAGNVPLDQIHRELIDVFSQTSKYSLQQITAVTSWLRSELLRNKRISSDGVTIKTKPTNEDIDFDNPIKNASREWHVANIARHIGLEQREKMRFLLLPGKNDFDIEALKRIGISTRNMMTFMLGEDPSATAEYIRMCRRHEIGERRIGDLKDILPTMKTPVGGVYWDFFGQICPAYIHSAWSLPIEENSELIPIGINVMKGREHKATKYGLLASAYRAITLKRLEKEGSVWDEKMEAFHFHPDESQLEGIDLPTARNDFLQGAFLDRVGVANTKNWLLPEHARRIIEIYLQFKNVKKTYDELSEVEKFTYFEQGMALIAVVCREIDSTAEEQRSPMTAPMTLLSAGAAMGLVNRPTVQALEGPIEYKSTHKNRPFVSFFGVVQTNRRHYEKQAAAMEFFFDMISHYTPLFLQRVVGGREIKDGIGIFQVSGGGPRKEVTYRDISGEIIASIRHDALIEACVELNVSQAKSIRDGKINSDIRTRVRQVLERNSDTADMIHAADYIHSNKTKGGSPRGITVRNEGVKTERNGPCPCGSGKKFKKCCMGH